MILLALSIGYLFDKVIVSKKNTYAETLEIAGFVGNTYVTKKIDEECC